MQKSTYVYVGIVMIACASTVVMAQTPDQRAAEAPAPSPQVSLRRYADLRDRLNTLEREIPELQRTVEMAEKGLAGYESGRGAIALLDGRADQGATLVRCQAWPQRD